MNCKTSIYLRCNLERSGQNDAHNISPVKLSIHIYELFITSLLKFALNLAELSHLSKLWWIWLSKINFSCDWMIKIKEFQRQLQQRLSLITEMSTNKSLQGRHFVINICIEWGEKCSSNVGVSIIWSTNYLSQCNTVRSHIKKTFFSEITVKLGTQLTYHGTDNLHIIITCI